ncbi:hypothetical protein RRG08_027108 [Elysia crispata]|uniref:Uncharacterized protein n=1 Tax=Elysia crispata TaxID=231223 RepID=A0AAE0YXQ3_9GAST|nr:hypothetical protein RRG08_027108 [Elysia crispata]
MNETFKYTREVQNTLLAKQSGTETNKYLVSKHGDKKPRRTASEASLLFLSALSPSESVSVSRSPLLSVCAFSMSAVPPGLFAGV